MIARKKKGLMLKAAGLVLLFATAPAWAVQHAKAHKARPSAATQASLTQARQKLEQQQAQVKQLQGSVAKQESDSKQASERLQQQDQAIAQMQQELQALQAKQGSGHR